MEGRDKVFGSGDTIIKRRERERAREVLQKNRKAEIFPGRSAAAAGIM